MAETARICEAEGIRAVAISANVVEESKARSAVERTLAEFGGLDLLVCNAGVVSAGPHEELPMAEWRRIFDINLFGAIHFVNAALPALRKSSHARVVLTGSSQAIMPNNPLTPAYTASKFALRGYAEAIRPVMARERIAFNFFCPGLTRTDFPINALRFGGQAIPTPDLDAALSPDEVAEQLLRGIREGRFLISTSTTAAEVMHRNVDDLLRPSTEVHAANPESSKEG